MTEVKNPAPDNHDEIDLLNVLERLFSFVGRYKRLLLLAAIAGMLSGIIIYLALPKEYASRMILHSNVLTNPEEIAIISDWSALLKNGEYDVLSQNLDCSNELLHKIKYLTADEIQKVQTSNTSSGFTVDVLVKDTAILGILQKAIIYGLANNDYVKERVDIRKANTTKIITDINHEIAKLDSTKKKIEGSNAGKTHGPSSFIVDISNVNIQMIQLNEKLYQYQEQLKFVDAIQVLQNFEKYSKPDSPRLSFLMISGFIGGLFLAYMLICYKYLNQKIALIRETREKNKGEI